MSQRAENEESSTLQDTHEKRLDLHLTWLAESFPNVDAKVVGFGTFSKFCVSNRFETAVIIKKISVSNLLLHRDETALSSLRHPNVITCYGFREIDHFKYVFLECCRHSLENYCFGWYKGPLPDRLSALFQMSDGLYYIHSQNLVHRSINPKNIFIVPSSSGDWAVFKLSDFGIGVPSWEDYVCLTTRHFFKWSSWYHSPELIRRHRNTEETLDPRTHPFGSTSGDIFSMGCVFFTFLTKGYHPFSPKDPLTCRLIETYILSNSTQFHHLGTSNEDVKALIELMIHAEQDKRPSSGYVNFWLKTLIKGGIFHSILNLPYGNR